MPKIYAFDRRGGKDLINEQVTAGGRQRTPAPTGLDAWQRHPRITVSPEVRASTPVPPVQQPRPTPANEIERLQRYGGVYAAAAMLAGEPLSGLAARAEALEPTGGGVYEALMRAARDRA